MKITKNQIIGGIAVPAIAALAAYNLSINKQEDKLADMALANIEALAQESGENGTPVGVCYLESMQGDYDNKVPCDSRTSNSMIYPCLSRRTGWFSINTDRCTK